METLTPQEQAKQFIADMNAKAEELYTVRAELSTREEEYKQKTDNLFAREAELRAKILEDLRTIGLKSIKVTAGDSYFISKREKYLPKDLMKFDRWARENNLVTINNEMVKTHLGRMETLPDFIEKVETESISVRKAPTKND
jgi:hypothetical protein